MNYKTDVQQIGSVSYCIFCGSSALLDASGSYHNGDYDEFFSCRCDGAKAKHDMLKELWNAKNEFLKTQESIVGKYKHHLVYNNGLKEQYIEHLQKEVAGAQEKQVNKIIGDIIVDSIKRYS